MIIGKSTYYKTPSAFKAIRTLQHLNQSFLPRFIFAKTRLHILGTRGKIKININGVPITATGSNLKMANSGKLSFSICFTIEGLQLLRVGAISGRAPQAINFSHSQEITTQLCRAVIRDSDLCIGESVHAEATRDCVNRKGKMKYPGDIQNIRFSFKITGTISPKEAQN